MTSGLREMPCLFCGVMDERLRFREDPFRVVQCRRCGLTQDLPDPSLSRAVADLGLRAGFELDEPSARIQGVCPRCRAARRRPSPATPGNSKQ